MSILIYISYEKRYFLQPISVWHWPYILLKSTDHFKWHVCILLRMEILNMDATAKIAREYGLERVKTWWNDSQHNQKVRNGSQQHLDWKFKQTLIKRKVTAAELTISLPWRKIRSTTSVKTRTLRSREDHRNFNVELTHGEDSDLLMTRNSEWRPSSGDADWHRVFSHYCEEGPHSRFLVEAKKTASYCGIRRRS